GVDDPGCAGVDHADQPGSPPPATVADLGIRTRYDEPIWKYRRPPSISGSPKTQHAQRAGSAGGRIYPNGNGPLCAKIIRRTEIAGIISRTITRGAARIAGAKTDCSASLIGNAASASHL